MYRKADYFAMSERVLHVTGPRAAGLAAFHRLTGTKQQAVINKIVTTLSSFYEGHKGGAVPGKFNPILAQQIQVVLGR